MAHPLLSRLARPSLFLGPHPSLRAACVPPAAAPPPSSSSEAGPSAGEPSAPEQPLRTWASYAGAAGISRQAHDFAALLSPLPRVTWFGEQHHQPAVLSAQLQLLAALHDASAGRQVHLVLEPFALPDQALLDAFARRELPLGKLAGLYNEHSEEGFGLAHYAPLLVLARDLKVKVWAGFPPRSWARAVFKQERADAMRDLTAWDRARAEATSDAPDAEGGAPDPCRSGAAYTQLGLRSYLHTPPLGAAAHRLIYTLTTPHRTYLSSLFRPDAPPAFPPMVSRETAQAAVAHLKDTAAMAHWQAADRRWRAATPSSTEFAPHLVAPQVQEKGFGPAQAVKDTYFAHVIHSILVRHPDDIVLAVAGAGHVEYYAGAPERLRAMQRAQEGERSETEEMHQLLVVTKPQDSAVWGTDKSEPSKPAAAAMSGWEELALWERPCADAVVLYEWDDGDAASDSEPASTVQPAERISK